MALSDMTILLADGVCSDCGDRPDPGCSSHRLSLLEEIYSAAVRMVKQKQNFFLLRCLGDGTETSSSGVFSRLSALSRVISLDLIDLDAHAGTRVRPVLGDRRVGDGLDLRRRPAADSTCCKGKGRRASVTRGRSARVRAPLRMSRLGRVPQLCGSQGYRAVSRPA